MSVNPAVERLGFQASDKVAIIHVDDVGMCGATLDAFSDLWAKRSVTCGSVMVPCPWFRATAQWARANPDVDLGVHATLTCEWNGYRWGPLSTADMASGLMDEERAFHKTSEAVALFAKPEAAKREIQLQIATAKEAGINVTHLDTHMGSVMHWRLYQRFVEAALEAGLAPFSIRLEEDRWNKELYAPESIEVFSNNTRALQSKNVPMLDRISMLTLQDGEHDRVNRTLDMVSKVKPGQISYLIFHPAADTPELRAICPDWRSRVADYEMLAAGTVRQHLENQGVKLIGCRELQALMPRAA
ncbi:MAG: polysaccharide deacetylase family protein [Parvibaculum sp.]|nr:polysaccharide deacetylase family protein [Parvibaculum sp.]